MPETRPRYAARRPSRFHRNGIRTLRADGGRCSGSSRSVGRCRPAGHRVARHRPPPVALRLCAGIEARCCEPAAERSRWSGRVPVAATWDADGGLGVLVGKRAMEACLAKAAATGIGMIAVRNGRHFGAAGYYAHMAARRDMIGMAMCNVPAIANAAGGLDRVYGTNPIAFGAPIEGEQPFLLDIATTAVAGREAGDRHPPGKADTRWVGRSTGRGSTRLTRRHSDRAAPFCRSVRA